MFGDLRETRLDAADTMRKAFWSISSFNRIGLNGMLWYTR